MPRYIDADSLKLDIDLSKGATVLDVALAVIKSVEEAPTADVVPKSEVEALIAGQETLQRHIAEKDSEIERLERILNSYSLQYGTVTDQQKVINETKAEVAREIFEKIEGLKHTKWDWNDYIDWDAIAELKKKYTA